MRTYGSLKLYLFIISVVFLAFDSMTSSILTFIFLDILLAIIVLTTAESKTQKFATITSYSFLLAVQISYTFFVISDRNYSGFFNFVVMFIFYLLLSFSFSLDHYLEVKNYHKYFFHDAKNASSLPFSDLAAFTELFRKKKELVGKTAKFMTRDNILHIMGEIKRNDSFSYINNGTLTEEYFKLLDNSIDDTAVYIVLSDTGSVASEFLSLFTDKPYNHVSISFDRELRTLISYNGGARVNPPGLNSEMLEFLGKKENAIIYIYRLDVTREQKQIMIDKIKDINANGSAYNMLGLVLKNSYKPNIMYCSQFVYTLLDLADATYFEKNKYDVKPTDLVELDYHKKLKFEYEIQF